jgi:hypothetical protein
MRPFFTPYPFGIFGYEPAEPSGAPAAGSARPQKGRVDPRHPAFLLRAKSSSASWMLDRRSPNPCNARPPTFDPQARAQPLSRLIAVEDARSTRLRLRGLHLRIGTLAHPRPRLGGRLAP